MKPFLPKNNPWRPGYAISKDIDDQPTDSVGPPLPSDLRRKTVLISGSDITRKFTNPWDSGYAIPHDVYEETVAAGPGLPSQLRRGTVFAGLGAEPTPVRAVPVRTPVPTKPGVVQVVAPVKGTATAAAPVKLDPIVGSYRDPIANFGRDTAKKIMAEIKKLPSADARKKAIEAVLDAVSPGLNAAVKTRAEAFAKGGQDPATAVERGLAIALSNQLMKEILDLGMGKKTSAFGLLGFGCCCGQAKQMGMGGLLDPFKAVGKAIGGAASGIAHGFEKLGKGVGKVAVAIGKAIGKGVCAAANSGVLDQVMAAGGAAGAGAVGVPPGVGASSGQLGSKLIGSACKGKGHDGGPLDDPSMVPGLSPTVKVAIVGGGLAALAYLLL